MAHQQLVGRITMEVAPSKLPSMMARRARLPRNHLDPIAEDDKEAAMESQSSPRAAPPLHNESRGGVEVIVDSPMHCADKLAFLAPMAKTECCLKIKA